MYEITLDLPRIREIRKYNKIMNNKPANITSIKYKQEGGKYKPEVVNKTGIAGYSSFEGMTCTNGERCISSKIREWGVRGCAIKQGFNAASYPRCGTTTDKW